MHPSIIFCSYNHLMQATGDAEKQASTVDEDEDEVQSAVTEVSFINLDNVEFLLKCIHQLCLVHTII
jgi:hypothetical protein